MYLYSRIIFKLQLEGIVFLTRRFKRRIHIRVGRKQGRVVDGTTTINDNNDDDDNEEQWH